MRVLVVHSRYRSNAPSGENNVVDQEAAALADRGHEVELFQRRSDEIASWPVHRRAMLPARTVYSGSSRRELTVELGRFRPDVVHIHNTFPMITPTVLYACRDAGVPVVVTIHNYKLLCASGDFFRDGMPCHDCAGSRGGAAVRHGCYRGSRLATIPVVAGANLHRGAWRRLVSAYIFISAAQRDLMQDLGLPSDRIFVKHNFVPPADVCPDEREHKVVYLGRLDAAKGAPFLMRAWDSFRARDPQSQLRLVIAGGGPMAEAVRSWSATRPSVEVLGLLPRDAAADVLRQAVAVVVPSQWEETFGLVAVEAMAAGVAAIAPDRGSFPELITDRVTGALFEPERPEALASILREVDSDPQVFVRYGRDGRTSYEKRFHPDVNLDELLDVYRFAVRNPSTTLR